MAESRRVTLPDPAATEELGRRLADAWRHSGSASVTIYLVGDLGAGKTTLARGFLRALGHDGRVPSPTYTLVEPYALAKARVLHLDLYRIRDPSELADLGLREQLGEGTVALVEWPDHGTGELPAADLAVHLAESGAGRQAMLEAQSAGGARLLACLE